MNVIFQLDESVTMAIGIRQKQHSEFVPLTAINFGATVLLEFAHQQAKPIRALQGHRSGGTAEHQGFHLREFDEVKRRIGVRCHQRCRNHQGDQLRDWFAEYGCSANGPFWISSVIGHCERSVVLSRLLSLRQTFVMKSLTIRANMWKHV